MLKAQKAFILIITILLFYVNENAQSKKADEIIIQSWQTGKETIINQQIELSLSTENKNYQTFNFSNSGKKYRLSVNFLPVSKTPLTTSGKTNEGWMVELREVNVNEKNEEEFGINLLTKTKEEFGQDYFPLENKIGYLIFEGTETIVKMYYPIKIIRKIKIEGFYVIIAVKDYQINAVDNHKIDYLKVSIELKNECKESSIKQK